MKELLENKERRGHYERTLEKDGSLKGTIR